jgi:hypothetical protein
MIDDRAGRGDRGRRYVRDRTVHDVGDLSFGFRRAVLMDHRGTDVVMDRAIGALMLGIL